MNSLYILVSILVARRYCSGNSSACGHITKWVLCFRMPSLCPMSFRSLMPGPFGCDLHVGKSHTRQNAPCFAQRVINLSWFCCSSASASNLAVVASFDPTTAAGPRPVGKKAGGVVTGVAATFTPVDPAICEASDFPIWHGFVKKSFEGGDIVPCGYTVLVRQRFRLRAQDEARLADECRHLCQDAIVRRPALAIVT